MKTVDMIVNARHYAEARGVKTVREFTLKLRDDISKSRGVSVLIRGINDTPKGAPVYARVWQGQWIADCKCGGASFIDPEDAFFFCFGCGNRQNENRPRPVVVPEDWKEIEQALLARPVDDMAGLTDLERVAMAKPLIHIIGKGGLARNWDPGETVVDLRAQQDDPIEKYHKSKGRR